MNKVCAIIVTYNADNAILRESITATNAQVDRLYLIDNGSATKFQDCIKSCENIRTVFLQKNLGIAAAQNIGIQMAREDGIQYILLLDHDSIPQQGMVKRFCDVSDQLRDRGIKVAAIGPRHRDSMTSHVSMFVSFKWFHFRTSCGRENSSIVPTDFLISSGSFYNIAVFDQVGLFNESLFIDHVDTEWFHRARSLGYRAFGISDIIMEHSIGERAIAIWLLRWRTQPIHKPLRLYYIMRNSLLMYRMPHTPLKWRTGDFIRLFRLICIYLLFSHERIDSLGYIMRGLIDGLHGNSGPYKCSKRKV